MISSTLTMTPVRVYKLPRYDALRLNGREAGRVKHEFGRVLAYFLQNTLYMTRRQSNDFIFEGEKHWLHPLDFGGPVNIENLVFLPDLALHGAAHRLIASQTATMADGDTRQINVPMPQPGTLIWKPIFPVPMRSIGIIERRTPEFLHCINC